MKDRRTDRPPDRRPVSRGLWCATGTCKVCGHDFAYIVAEGDPTVGCGSCGYENPIEPCHRLPEAD